MAIKKWILPTLDADVAAKLAEECEINPFLALLLTTRGITEPEEAYAFLTAEEREDPFSFADMDAAVERITAALDTGERIAVYGDYDVDGITATALLYDYLKQRGGDVIYALPTREGGGYGLHTETVDAFYQQGVRLIITVDNGITAVDEVAYAASLGIDTVVTDHHKPQGQLPCAVAVVDPHRADCMSGCVNYAGVGVAFMLVCALEGDYDAVMESYGDLVALGTLADVMPLTGSTRGLVRDGLYRMGYLHRVGLRALVQEAGLIDKELTATRVVFALSPRLNAAGRVGDPDIAVRLLLEQNLETAKQLAEQIGNCNTTRQAQETQVFKAIEQRLRENPAILADRVLVLEGDDWPIGIIGILAARLTERYGKPTLLLSVKDGVAKGSGRSIEGFSLFDALENVREHLIAFGGHALAAGVTLSPENIAAFRAAINAYAATTYPEMPVPTLRLDFKLRPTGIDAEKLAMIAALEPFGNGNPAPVFGLFGMRLDNITPIGNGKHLRLSFSKGDVRVSVLKFHTEYADFPATCGALFNLAVVLEKNVYKGAVSVSVLLKDIQYADTDQQAVIDAARQYDALCRKETKAAGADLIPPRPLMAKLYRYLCSRKTFVGSIEQLQHILEEPNFSFLSIRVMIEIWRQAGLLEVTDNGDNLHITVIPADNKMDLTATKMWQYLCEE